MQPWFGLGLGIVGVGLLLGDALGKQRPVQPNQFPAQVAQQPATQQQFEQQQFPAQPAQQFPQQ